MQDLEVRCLQCGKLLAKNLDGSVEIKCSRCGVKITYINAEKLEPLLMAVLSST